MADEIEFRKEEEAERRERNHAKRIEVEKLTKQKLDAELDSEGNQLQKSNRIK